MNWIEKWTGNIIAGILILLFIYSILASLFALLFRDGRGLNMYGSRGQFYMEY
jgi:hypothetical protein